MPLRVCSFESRKTDEMRSLIERFGGTATVVPSMREVPLEENADVFSFVEQLFAGRIDIVIFMTGVGARALLSAVETRFDREPFLDALRSCCVIVRGPKPVTVLREWNVPISYRAAEPNTWRELVAVFDEEYPSRHGSADGLTVAIQEYGVPSERLYEELERRRLSVVPVPVYRWALPEDTEPLQTAINATIAGEFDVLVFTSANQLTNVLSVADAQNVRQQWLQAAQNCIIASIGPTATERIKAEGLQVDIEPEYPKMGHLVRSLFSSSAEQD